jgi:hypothetical protein
MSNNSIKALALAGVAAAALTALAPSAAKAACCVAYDYQDAANNKNQVISQLTDKINAMQLAIIEAMRLGTGQLSGNLAEQIGAHSNVANVQDDRSVTGRVEAARLASIASAASGSSSCNVITGANAMANLPGAVKQTSDQTTQSLVAWDAGTDQNLPSYKGQDVGIVARVQLHCSQYGTQDDVNAGLCTAVGTQTAASDVDITKSLYNSATPGSDGETLDPAHQAAAKAFLVNTMDPRPQGGSLAGSGAQPGGQLAAGDKESNTARLSIAFQAASDAFARRAPLSAAAAAQWASALSGQMGQTMSAAASTNISQYDLMGARAKGWFFNTNWATAADSQSEQQAIKDMTMMMSFQTYMQWEQYRLSERQNLLLAAMLSIQTQQARAQQINTQQ